MQNLRTSSDFIHKNNFFAFLAGIAILGVLLGVMSYCFMSEDFLKQMALAQENFIDMRKNQDFAHILIKSFTSSTIFLGSAFVLGFSAIAQPVELMIPLIKGLGLGVTIAQVYTQSGKGGMLTCLLIILPCTVISMYALLMVVREAIGLSNILMSDALSIKQSDGLLPTVKLYAAKFLVLEAVVAVSAAVDCVCTVVFAGSL